MKIIVTCGPASSPIDEVRKITNFATGEIGTLLSDTLSALGHEVICFRGDGSTYPILPSSAKLQIFDTNDSLLAGICSTESVDAIFHAAALGDFSVATVEVDGMRLDSKTGKIPSNAGSVVLRLLPSIKILPQLRAVFPDARIVGWKYELNENKDAALLKAQAQIKLCNSDACVVNGEAYGRGYGFLEADGSITHCKSKQTLANFCAQWLTR